MYKSGVKFDTNSETFRCHIVIGTYIAENHARFSAASESEAAIKLRAITTSAIRDNRVWTFSYVQLHPHINYPTLVTLAIWE